jgi:hypothetical protein
MLDVNGQSIGDGTLELVKFAETASAVNEITVTNSATGNAPEIASSGDDTNIDLKLTPKGTGKLNLDGIKFPNADGSAGQVLTTDGSGVLSFSTILADGTADWDTTVKTADFTATANKGFFCNTTSAAFTVTLPATPSAGDEIIIVDYAGTFDTFALVINPNGGKIEGATANLQLSGEREGARLVYIDSTQGWLAYSGINEGTDALAPVTYSADFLVIAGGASGGSGTDGSTIRAGGGGGAGGYRSSNATYGSSGGGGSAESSLTFTLGTVYTITVGAGGASTTGEGTTGNNGSNSSLSGTGITTITSTGGGGGGKGASSSKNGTTGGSGGGGGTNGGSAGSGTSNQGFAGGTGFSSAGGGGGGASAVGSIGFDNAGNSEGGAGGNGVASTITGSSVTRAGGAGGGGNNKGNGGTGGGGNGANQNPTTSLATAGTINTGSGGGGAFENANLTNGATTGAGGKGVVILRMSDASYSGTTTGSPTVTTGVGGTDTVIVFNDSGSYTG